MRGSEEDDSRERPCVFEEPEDEDDELNGWQ
jgi:hypothetical protein